MAPFNFAANAGIKSLPAAVVFAILYVFLFAYFLMRVIARPCYIYGILTFFATIRIVAFILRALLSHDQSVADNLNAFLAYEILYNVGFFGLLYSAYILVTGRVANAKNPPNGPISRLLQYHFLFRIALTAAVAIGISGSVMASTSSSISSIDTGNTLRKVSIYIFLVCVILVLLQSFFLARVEFSETNYRDSNDEIGAVYGIYFLLVISLLLVAREAFFAATISNSTEQDKEALWYPLAVVTEFIAVVLFAVPGLVSGA